MMKKLMGLTAFLTFALFSTNSFAARDCTPGCTAQQRRAADTACERSYGDPTNMAAPKWSSRTCMRCSRGNGSTVTVASCGADGQVKGPIEIDDTKVTAVNGKQHGVSSTGKPGGSVAGAFCHRRCGKSKNKKKCFSGCVKRFKVCGKQCGKQPKKTQWKCMEACMGTPPTNLKKPNKSMIKAAHSGRCLDVPAFKKKNGVLIHQWKCNGKGNQRWTMDGIGRIKNLHSGKCLDIKGGKAKNGAPVLQWDCHKKRRQRWQMTPGGQIKSQLGNQCLAIKGWNKKNRGALVIWKCKKDANQKFSIH
jgi:hypothetical protein